MRSVPQIVRRTIQKYDMLKPGDRVVIGVSGGGDSMALMHILREISPDYHLWLVVAHLDHGLRAEGKQDELFVRRAAADLGIPFEGRKVDVRVQRQKQGLNLQEAARQVRYAFLRGVAKKYRAAKIALGHTADDQAESVIMRFLRGSGTRGLSGIPPVREEVFIRPLIEVWRAEIEAFLQEKKIPYLSDPSNRSGQFLRSRIRHELLPILRQYNPRIREVLVQMADLFRAEEIYWQALVEEKFPGLVLNDTKHALTLDIPSLLKQPFPLRLRMLRFALEKLMGNLRQMNFVHFLSMDRLLKSPEPNQRLSLPRGLTLVKAYRSLTLAHSKGKKEETAAFEHKVLGPGIIDIPEIGRTMQLEYKEASPLEPKAHPANIALLDGDTISFPLILRSIRPGDRFQPLGMEGDKKVKDLLIDCKIPVPERKKIPLLLEGDQILWVGGIRIDHRARLKPQTRRILFVQLS